MTDMMKHYDRFPLALPGPTLGGKRGVVLRPGEQLLLRAVLPPVEFPVRRHLRIAGEVDIFWRWRCEPGMPLLYRSIRDALDPVNAFAEKYSLHLQGRFEPWPRNAFIMLPLEGVPRGCDLTFAIMARTRGLKLAEEGEVSAELGIYLSKDGRHPQDVTDLPDRVFKLTLAEGTREWRELHAVVRFPQDAASVLVRVGGVGFSGDAWLGSPRLYAEGGDTLIPPLMPENPHPPWHQFNWLGENLSRLEQPGFAVRCAGREFFRGPTFNSISRHSDFELLLPPLSAGAHLFELELLADHPQALPFVVQSAEVLQESARPVELIAVPEYVEENRPFGVLVEYNEGGHSRLEGVAVEDSGGACANPSFDLTVKESAFQLRPRRVVRGSGRQIVLSTGDAIYIPQEREAFLSYLAWYAGHQIGNGLCIRPAYRWGGGRAMNPALWREVVPILEKLGMRYHLMADGRELPGKNVNPPDDVLAGPLYLGRQEHERDGAFSYWGHMRDEALYVWLYNRGGGEQIHLGLAAPAVPCGGWLEGCFDQLKARDMQEAADLFLENVRLAKKTCTRHTGPTTLFHYFYKAGFDWLGAEQMYGPEEVILSSLRGASRAYNRTDFGAHLAVQWSSAPLDTPRHALRYFLSLATCYLQEASAINTEEGLWRMDSDYAPFDRFSAACDDHRRWHSVFRRFMQTHPRRGSMRVPLAVLQGRHCGWRCFGRGPVWGSRRNDFAFGPPEDSFDLLRVFYPRSVLDAVYRFPCDDNQPQGWYSGTPYGPIDLIPLEGPGPISSRYRALVFMGWNTFAEEDFNRLADYVEQGGLLLLARSHLSVHVKRGQAPVLPERSLALARLLGDTQAGVTGRIERRIGAGRLIYYSQEAYPSEASIRQGYEADLRALGEETVLAECGRGWIRGHEDVNFAAYDWDEGRLRTVYVLNVDHWSGRQTASAVFLFGGRSYDLTVRLGTIEVITMSASLAVMPEGPDVDVLEMEERPDRIRIRVQSDSGAVLRVFAPTRPAAPETLVARAGGVQDLEIPL